MKLEYKNKLPHLQPLQLCLDETVNTSSSRITRAGTFNNPFQNIGEYVVIA